MRLCSFLGNHRWQPPGYSNSLPGTIPAGATAEQPPNCSAAPLLWQLLAAAHCVVMEDGSAVPLEAVVLEIGGQAYRPSALNVHPGKPLPPPCASLASRPLLAGSWYKRGPTTLQPACSPLGRRSSPCPALCCVLASACHPACLTGSPSHSPGPFCRVRPCCPDPPKCRLL